jgi:hypothetical protein
VWMNLSAWTLKVKMLVFQVNTRQGVTSVEDLNNQEEG